MAGCTNRFGVCAIAEASEVRTFLSSQGHLLVHVVVVCTEAVQGKYSRCVVVCASVVQQMVPGVSPVTILVLHVTVSELPHPPTM